VLQWNVITNYPHITTDPAVHEGRPCISGTQIKVTDVASAVEEGKKALELPEYFRGTPQPLTMGEIYAALAYYSDNEAELARVQAADKIVSDKAEHTRLEKIKDYYLGR
jgi:uncharacterized protein (DUF433 family)